MRPLIRPLLVAGSVVGLVVLAAVTVAVQLAARSSAYAASVPVLALLLLAVGVVGAAGVVCLMAPWTARAGALLCVLAAADLISQWGLPSAPDALVFTAGLVMTWSVVAFATHLALHWPGLSPPSRWTRTVIGFGYLFHVLVLGVAASMAYDPRSKGCFQCPRNVLNAAPSTLSSLQVFRAGATSVLVWSSILVVTLAWRYVHAGVAYRQRAIPPYACLTVLVGAQGVALWSSLPAGYVPNAMAVPISWVEQAALLTIGVSMGFRLVQAARARGSLARVVMDLAEGPSTAALTTALDERLGVTGLQLAYPLDGTTVDASGHPVTVAPGELTTPMRFESHELARLRHSFPISRELLDEATSTLRLGLESQRLRAESLARLRELEDSRMRVVQATDRERRRTERDLHDGVQMRLVTLLLRLRLLHSRADPRSVPLLAEVEELLEAAIHEVRDTAGRLAPPNLDEAGLGAALMWLSETRPVIVRSFPRLPLRVEAERTVYECVERASRSGETRVSAATSRGLSTVRLDTDHPPDLGELSDSVEALGGTVQTQANGQSVETTITLPRRADLEMQEPKQAGDKP
jgi:signal transduction histidine kinase